MTDSKVLRLLVVEDDPEDEQLLCEALIEVDENRQWCNWRSAAVVQVDQLSDTLELLRKQSFDAVLLNLSLPDSPVLLDSFLEARAAAGRTPIVILSDENDEYLANRLLREGAQDVLVKNELDCASLARSIRYAVERQRRLDSLQTSAFIDELTGTLTRPGFFAIAEHYQQLSSHCRVNLIRASLEISGLVKPQHDGLDGPELLLVRAGEILRKTFRAPALLGRMDTARFGLISVGLTATTLEALLSRAAGEIQDLANQNPPYTVSVRYSMSALDPADDLDDLAESSSLAAPSFHPRLKTVMLAN